MLERELISIILPVYNASKYLDECIKSILDQSYKNYEAIFVDDGSKDNSLEILRKYQKIDNRVVVIHQDNQGVASARNIGLKYATGQYITFIDPDDYVYSNYLYYLKGLIDNNNCDIAISKGIVDSYKPNKKNTNHSLTLFTSQDAIVDILTYKMNVAVWNKMYKRDLLYTNHIKFDEELRMGEGFNFNIDAFKYARKIAIGYEQTYFYRRDNLDSATTKFSTEKWENAFLAINKIETKLFEFENLEIKNSIEFAKWHTYMDAYVLCCLSKSSKETEFFKKDTYLQAKKMSPIVLKIQSKRIDQFRAFCIMYCPCLLPSAYRLKRFVLGVKVKN